MNILVTYFDPFGGRPANNSQVIASLIDQKIDKSKFKITLCELPTVYDKAYEVMQDCLNSMDIRADIVISLGEAGCSKLKIETRGINLDKSFGPDNDGIQRDNTEIVPGGPQSIGVTLPMDKAYCTLSKTEKKSVYISHTAGSFVCNNTTYLGLTNLDIPYTFLHVPTASCASEKKNEKISNVAVKLIASLEKLEITNQSLPKNKEEVSLKLDSDLSSCERSFYKILKNEY